MYNVTFKFLPNVTFQFSPVAFTIFGKEIYWYGIVITLGIVLSVLYAFWRAKKLGVKTDDMYDYAIFTVIFGVIGARLYYVLTNLDTLNTFEKAIAVWNGGLGIYGGIIAGAITVLIVSKIKKINPLTILDAAAPATMIGQLIGRWGNYFNQEAFGCNTTLPWGMKSWVENNSTQNTLQGTVEYLRVNQADLAEQGMIVDPTGYVHPTFLYESLWNLIGFVLIHFLYKKRVFKGQMFLMYISWYGFGRMLIESLRTDSLYIPGTNLRISMVVGFVCFIVGIILLMIFTLLAKKNPPVLETPIVSEPKKKKHKFDTSAGDGVTADEVSDLKALDGDTSDEKNTNEEESEEKNTDELTALDGEEEDTENTEDIKDTQEVQDTDSTSEDSEDGNKN